MSGNSLKGINMQIDEMTEKRLWKALETIQSKLSGIETQLSEVVRLEERVHNHEKTLGRFGNTLENHETRIRESELWQAKSGDRGSVERLISNVQEDVRKLELDLSSLNKTISKDEGEKGVSKSILKWAVGILTSVVLLFIAGAIK